MVKNHQKRISTPRSWKISRRDNKFITRMYPCGHEEKYSLPLNVLIRDFLGFAKTSKEVKNILNNKIVQVNSKRMKDIKKAIGLFDIISFHDIKKHYIIVLDSKGNLVPKEFPEKESSLLLQKITSKKLLKKGRLQLGFFGGRTMIVDKEDFKTGDSVIIDLVKKKIAETIPFEKGKTIFLLDGKHIGKSGKVEDFDEKLLLFKDSGNQVHETLKGYAIVISDTIQKILKSED